MGRGQLLIVGAIAEGRRNANLPVAIPPNTRPLILTNR
jgi:hypothetical protein